MNWLIHTAACTQIFTFYGRRVARDRLLVSGHGRGEKVNVFATMVYEIAEYVRGALRHGSFHLYDDGFIMLQCLQNGNTNK